MRSQTLLLLLLAFALVACGGEKTPENAETAMEDAVETAAVTLADAAVPSAERAVMCGCTVEAIGHCGNYVEIDGQHVEIANAAAMDLGKMEWCGQSGVKAQTAGAIVDGRFVATEIVVAGH
jgi:hypothetical protein